jgi:hypothetical protein
MHPPAGVSPFPQRRDTPALSAGHNHWGNHPHHPSLSSETHTSFPAPPIPPFSVIAVIPSSPIPTALMSPRSRRTLEWNSPTWISGRKSFNNGGDHGRVVQGVGLWGIAVVLYWQRTFERGGMSRRFRRAVLCDGKRSWYFAVI